MCFCSRVDSGHGIWGKVTKKKGKENLTLVRELVCLVSSSWWAFLCPAFSAVDWSGWVGFEGDFAFLTAFRAGCLMHLFFCHRRFQLLFSVFGARIGVACTLDFIAGGLGI